MDPHGLNHLVKKWQALGIESDFPAVHHFSSERFKTKSSSPNTFVSYCADKELGGENTQTLERATAADPKDAMSALHDGPDQNR